MKLCMYTVYILPMCLYYLMFISLHFKLLLLINLFIGVSFSVQDSLSFLESGVPCVISLYSSPPVFTFPSPVQKYLYHKHLQTTAIRQDKGNLPFPLPPWSCTSYLTALILKAGSFYFLYFCSLLIWSKIRILPISPQDPGLCHSWELSSLRWILGPCIR